MHWRTDNLTSTQVVPYCATYCLAVLDTEKSKVFSLGFLQHDNTPLTAKDTKEVVSEL